MIEICSSEPPRAQPHASRNEESMRTFALAAMMLACSPAAARASEDALKAQGPLATAEPNDAFAGDPSDAPALADSALEAIPIGLEQEPLSLPQAEESPSPGPSGVTAEDRVIPDPWEKFNRSMFAVNDVLDRFILAPAAIAYAVVTPKPLRRGIANALDNANSPVIIANDLLQLKFKRAGVAFARLAVNSTVGIGGFLDVGSRIGLKQHTEDFGQTLGHWGVSTGPYLFLPLLGPTTVRDGVGAGADIALTPFSWTEFAGFRVLRWSRAGLTALEARADALRPLAELRRTSADPYTTIRTFYALARKSAITDGTEDAGDLPEFGDPLDFEGEVSDGAETSAPQEDPVPEPAPQEELNLAAAPFEHKGGPLAPTASSGFAPVEADLEHLY